MRTAALASARLMFVLALSASVPLSGRGPEVDHLAAGKAALDVGDPRRAIAEFEQVDTRNGREWLSAALMMEARSPSDAFVERAFAVATRSRSQAGVLHKDIAATLRPGDLVVATIVGERHAFAWAFDRDRLVGFPLPAPADVRAAAERALTYAQRDDTDGLARISDDFLPSLLGPAYERVPSLKRLIVIVDGPLQSLPLGRLPIAPSQRPLEQTVETITIGYEGLSAAIQRPPTGPVRASSAKWALGGALVILLVIAGAAWITRRARRSVA